MPKKPILHNRLVRLWGNPTDAKLKHFYSSHGLFNSGDDAQNLVKYGSYLIFKGNQMRLEIKPYDPSKGLYNFIDAIQGEILFYVGVEYFIKGVYLHMGFAINVMRDGSKKLTKIKGNKGKLSPAHTHDLEYLLNHLDKIIDFSDFDNKQSEKNKIDRGKTSKGIISNKYKHPSHRELLRFIRFNRNVQLHTSKKIPEFRGNIDEVIELLEHIAINACGKTLKDLSDLEVVYF